VTGRVTEVNRGRANIELGEGIHGQCSLVENEAKQETRSGPVDLSAFSSMLASKWKGAGNSPVANEGPARPEPLRPGQIRTFRIVKLDAEKKKVLLELAN